MKTLPKLLISAAAATTFTTNAAHVQFDLTDFTTGNIARRTVYIKPSGTPLTNVADIVTGDGLRRFTDANGRLVVSNMAAAVYYVAIFGPETNTIFSINVPEFAGLTNAVNLLTSVAGVSDVAGYTIAQADGRFVLRNSGWASNLVATNLTLPGADGQIILSDLGIKSKSTSGSTNWFIYAGSGDEYINFGGRLATNNAAEPLAGIINGFYSGWMLYTPRDRMLWVTSTYDLNPAYGAASLGDVVVRTNFMEYFKLSPNPIAVTGGVVSGYVLTADTNGVGTWQASVGGLGGGHSFNLDQFGSNAVGIYIKDGSYLTNVKHSGSLGLTATTSTNADIGAYILSEETNVLNIVSNLVDYLPGHLRFGIAAGYGADLTAGTNWLYVRDISGIGAANIQANYGDFQGLTNAGAFTNAGQAIFGGRVLIIGNNASENYVWTCTNAVTGGGHWAVAPGEGSGDNIKINGTDVIDINLTNVYLTPGSGLGLTWTNGGGSPPNIGSYILFDPLQFTNNSVNILGIYRIPSTLITGTFDDTNIPSGVTRETEWDSSLKVLNNVGDATGIGLLVFNNNPTLTQPAITNFTSAQHNHGDADSGSQLAIGTALSSFTSTQLRDVVSDETGGNGNLVFNRDCTLTNVTIRGLVPAIGLNKIAVLGTSGMLTNTPNATDVEAEYLSGVMSPIQPQIDGKQATDPDLTFFAATGTNATGAGSLVRSNAPSIYNPTFIGDAGSSSLTMYNGNQSNTFIFLVEQHLSNNVYMVGPTNIGTNGDVLTRIGVSNTIWAASAGGGLGYIGVGSNTVATDAVGTNLIFHNAGNVTMSVTNTDGGNHVWLSAPSPAAGSTNLQMLTVTNSFRLGETNIVVGSPDPVILNLAAFNVFKLWLQTNCAIVFTNAAAGIANSLVYFQQDNYGGHTNLNMTNVAGLIHLPGGETFATNHLSTAANDLDILEVKSGFHATNLACWWPKGFGGTVAWGAVPGAGGIRISNTSYGIVGSGGTMTVHVQRTNGTAGNAWAELITIEGSATDPEHFTSNLFLLSWVDGNSDLKACEITVVTNETAGLIYFTNILQNVTNATIGDLASAEGIITNIAADVGNPGTNGLIAWYDFADATDAYADFDLIESNAPAYTPGPPSYGTALSATTAHWVQTTVDSSFGNTAHDWSYNMRFRINAGFTNSQFIFAMGNSKSYMRWYTASNVFVGFANLSTNCAVGLATNTWCNVTATFDNSNSNMVVYVNTTSYSGLGTAGFTVGDLTVAGSTPAVAQNCDIDAFSFWSRVLTTDEVAWFYNSGNTRTYSELTQ